ncbi:hypothetical protein N0V88_006633 [Collariella sp. IMI 366227]|nr:hypothetical protein N0V88_006633 [Collariella sp. IMI 366227]
MDPLSVTAAVVGITAPVVHSIHRLSDDIKNIVDAPETLDSLRKDLLFVDQALDSLQAVSDAQWKSLGETVVTQSKAATTSCGESCDRFRTALSRWTRHSENGKLSLRDRAIVGFFKQGYVKSMSEQLQHCQITLTSVVSIATFSLQQTKATEGMMTTISQKEADIAESIAATDKQLAEANAKLGALCLAKTEQDETEADRASAISQVAVEQAVLKDSRTLLDELLSAPGAFWDRTLKPKLQQLAAKKALRNKSYEPDETNVVVSITDRSKRDLTKRFDELDIDWEVVEDQLMAWSHLLRDGKRLRIDISFIYREGNTTGRRKDATDYKTRRHNRKHYKLDTSVLTKLIDFAEEGNTLRTHGDVPPWIRELIYAKDQQDLERLGWLFYVVNSRDSSG